MSMFDLDEEEDSFTVATTNKQNGEEEFSDDDGFEETISSLQSETEKSGKGSLMTAAERERAERNRMKAISLKKSRLMTHPYSKSGGGRGFAGSEQPKLVDSGGGFFIEETDGKADSRPLVVDTPGPILPCDQPTCEMCEKKFSDSYLLRTFDHVVCDNCKDTSKDGEHELIAKTEAKSTFLLRDFDLEETEHGPALKYKTRKNPHNRAGGDMKLFLRLQIERRALQIWGSEEALAAELEAREEKKILAKSKKYKKKMKELRMTVRSSLYKKDLSTHVHEYDEEVYHQDKDEYSQTCTSCGHINTYEKM